jgi:TaqI-like C-terminal specificity domain
MFASKILVPDIADRAAFALDEEGEFAFTSGYAITLKPEIEFTQKYLLALLNSRLLDYFWKRVSTPLRGGFYRYFTQFIEQFPIRPINFADKAERAEHDALGALVDRILKAKQANAAADTSALEREIDARVYRLYGLTPDEIRLVEESAPSSDRRAEPAPDSPSLA